MKYFPNNIYEVNFMREMILQITMWTYISYVPQIIKLIKTKKADDLSIASWVL